MNFIDKQLKKGKAVDEYGYDDDTAQIKMNALNSIARKRKLKKLMYGILLFAIAFMFCLFVVLSFDK